MGQLICFFSISVPLQSFPFQFNLIERKLNKKGTGLERNGNGTGLELKLNWNGMGTEWEWNGNGTKVQWMNNGSTF